MNKLNEFLILLYQYARTNNFLRQIIIQVKLVALIRVIVGTKTAQDNNLTNRIVNQNILLTFI